MKKDIRILKTVFYTLLGVFGLFIAIILLLAPVIFYYAPLIYAPLTTVLGLAALILSVVLIVLIIKAKVKGYQKLYLILTGFSPIAALISVLLHNFLDYFAETMAVPANTILGILSVAFFFIAIFVFPIAFIVGVVGSIIYFRRKVNDFVTHPTSSTPQ